MPDVTPPDADWDAWVSAAGREGDFLQTSEWAAMDDRVNRRVSRVVWTGTSTAGLVSWPREGRGELLCYRGPVVRQWRSDEATAFGLAAAEIARSHRCDVVRIVGRPPLSEIDTAAFGDALAAAGYAMTPWRTSVVDLAQDEEALLASFDRSVRKALRRCAAEGVTVRRCEGLDEIEAMFYEAYASSVEGFDRSRGRAVYELDTSHRYAYWVACDADRVVLATLATYRYGELLTEVMSGRTPAGIAAGMPAQDLLHWEVMRDHREHGGTWFDLAGYAEAPSTPKEEGIRRFKRKWAGREVGTPTFTRPVAGRVRRSVARVRARRR